MSLHQFDPVISKLTRMIMRDGKKNCALRIIDNCFSLLRTKHSIHDPADFTRSAIELAKPMVEVRKYNVGGRSIQVPSPCRPHRQESLALRFLRDSFRERKEHGSGLRLANELIDLDKRIGRTYKRRDDLHKRAEQNRGFAHFLK